MIPLMFIQKRDKLLRKTTAAISKLSASYSHLKHAIELHFRMNADMHFSLNILLNQFDMPSEVYIKTLRKGEYVKVSPDVKEYTIEGDSEVVVLTYEDILKIATNHLKYDDVVKWDIKAKMLNPDKDPDVVMRQFSYWESLGKIVFEVNKEHFSYLMVDGMPSLLDKDDNLISPRTVLGNYYIFDVKLDDEEYSIALLHIFGFKHHYLFRQTERTHNLTLEGKTIIDGYGDEYQFFNGMMVINNANTSVQKYLGNQYNREYVQYFFNAVRDANLYTEIANAFNILKHNSMMVYDYEKDERLIGRVSARVEFNNKTVPEIVIRMTNLKNQFQESVEGSFEFRTEIYRLPNLYSKTYANYRLLDYGYILKDGEFLSVARSIINIEDPDYISASNNKYLISISRRFIKQIIEHTIDYTIPIIKVLEDDVALNNLYTVLDIDFKNRKFIVSNIFEEVEVAFDNIQNSEIFAAKVDARLFSDSFTEGFGLKFKIKPDMISFNPVTSDRYNQILLMIKSTESDEYLLDDIIEDTNNLSNSMKVDIANREFLFVYNKKKDLIYYIDITNQDSSRDFNQVESMGAFMEIKDIVTLKTVLSKFSIKEFVVKNNGYGVSVDDDLNIVPYMVYNGLKGPIFSSREGLVKPNTNQGYSVENDKIKPMFGFTEGIFKEVFRGVFRSDEFEIESLSVENDALIIKGYYNGTESEFSVSVSPEGKYRCKNIFGEDVELKFDKSIESLQSFGPIAYADAFALDMNIVKYYIENKNFALNGEAFVGLDNEAYYIHTDKLETISTNVEYELNDITNVAIENWLGKELFGIISVEHLEEDGEDCYYQAGVYKTEDKTVYRIPLDLSKYIVQY